MELIFDIIEWHEVTFEASPPFAVYIKAANANVFLLDVLARKNLSDVNLGMCLALISRKKKIC